MPEVIWTGQKGLRQVRAVWDDSFGVSFEQLEEDLMGSERWVELKEAPRTFLEASADALRAQKA